MQDTECGIWIPVGAVAHIARVPRAASRQRRANTVRPYGVQRPSPHNRGTRPPRVIARPSRTLVVASRFPVPVGAVAHITSVP